VRRREGESDDGKKRVWREKVERERSTRRRRRNDTRLA
jgi:hypothetical protein